MQQKSSTKARKRGSRSTKSGITSRSKGKRKKKVNAEDEVYEPERNIVSESEKIVISEPPKKRRRRRVSRKKKAAKKSVECKEQEEVVVKSTDIDGVGDGEKLKEEVGVETDGDSSDDSEAEDHGLDGIFGGAESTDVVEPMKEDPTPKKTVKKRKRSVNKDRTKEEECNSDVSVYAKPKPKRKSPKRRKKPKEEYTREQIEMVFRKVDEEGNGRLSMENILHGFHTINLGDKIEAGRAKRMLLYADKQHDNDSVVRLDDLLAMTRLADLWSVA